MAKKTAKRRPGRAAIWPRPSATALAKDTLGFWANEYVTWLVERNYSARTASVRREYLMNFAAWCEQRSLFYPQEITRPILERYQRTLFEYRKADGKPLAFSAQFARLVTVRVYFRWLSRRHVLLSNPASELELPRLPQQLPRYVLTANEAEAILRLPNVDDVLGLRDRAMMEVLYATGMRRSELVNLRVFDIDVHRGTAFVRQGKGQRDRVVPLGERAVSWLEKYLSDARPELVGPIDDGALFLTAQGEPMTLSRATDVVHGYVQAAKLTKRGACHLFRHTAATLMLENGADLRYIQLLLGHADVSTTQVYTQVSIHKLKEIHALTHPGARLVPVQSGAQRGETRGHGDKREGLISLLVAESEDEREELEER